MLTLYNSCMWAETSWTGYRILDGITRICQSLDQGKKKNKTPTTCNATPLHLYHIYIYFVYQPCIKIWSMQEWTFTLYCLMYYRLHQLLQIELGGHWMDRTVTCTIVCWKQMKMKLWLLHLGFFVAFFPCFTSPLAMNIDPKTDKVQTEDRF